MSVRRESRPSPSSDERDELDRRPDGPAVHRRAAGPKVPSRALDAPGSRDEAEAQYVAAREAWTGAMRRASSGRSADLASLAIAQEAYEAALAEVELWRSGQRIPIPVQAERTVDIEVAVGQELEWRRLQAPDEPRPGFLAKLFRRNSKPR
jgi:hypothetical protein